MSRTTWTGMVLVASGGLSRARLLYVTGTGPLISPESTLQRYPNFSVHFSSRDGFNRSACAFPFPAKLPRNTSIKN